MKLNLTSTARFASRHFFRIAFVLMLMLVLGLMLSSVGHKPSADEVKSFTKGPQLVDALAVFGVALVLSVFGVLAGMELGGAIKRMQNLVDEEEV
jgi:uncharacterized membrane protein YfcA